MSDQPLGQFVDRCTMRYDRFYPHPVERVWKAVTTAEHLDAWMMPTNQVDAREGGRVAFSFGSPRDEALGGTVAELRPCTLIDYAFENGSRMRFELEPVEGGTRLVFIHAFPAGFVTEPPPFPDPGSDVPAGAGTPWRPGFTAGFHLCFDDLAAHLGGAGPTAAESQARCDAHFAGSYEPRWLELVETYRRHIVTTIPPD